MPKPKKVKPLSTEEVVKLAKKSQELWAKAEAKTKDLQNLELEAWKRILPRLLKELKASPKVDKGIMGDWLPEGLSGTEIHVVDSAGQHLDFRVGPTFTKKGVMKTPGLWIGFQRRHMSSSRQGDFLMSPAIWKRLRAEIDRRMARFSPKHYRATKS